MAALARHALFGGALARSTPVLTRSTGALLVPVRNKMKKPAQKPKKKATIESVMSSIEAKGFLRPYKPYQPPADASERVNVICESDGVGIADGTVIEDLLLRFKIFSKCANEFQHSIPNSRLVSIQTIGDLREFYNTPVFTTTPYEALQNMELPPNLHVQQDYHRFNPETDKLFGGKSAFPQSGTVVSGLKYKDKYQGHKPEKPWPIKVHDAFDNYK